MRLLGLKNEEKEINKKRNHVINRTTSKRKKDGEIRYLTPLNIETTKAKKYCRFKKSGIKYVDYKDPDFLMKFVNEQGKLLPRRLTGTSLKYQRKVSVAVKRARHLALMPYVADLLK
jgi:small subunit ribosomal protein S18